MINVLDNARPPQKHFKPRRLIIAFVAFLLSMMLSVLAATVHERWATTEKDSMDVVTDLRGMLQEVKRKPLG